ncbi:BTB/POZ domain-containing protein [Rhizophagus diaphanus]|nr:BTB/POZ domain-containing protein [Rhizophagus diaphanus] [Rhizophagus sp. MUCL 43196]
MSTLSNSLSNSLIKNNTNIHALSDIEILVGKIPNTEIFRLHSFILKVCSPYFRNLLSNEQKIKIENNIIKINIPNISVKIFKIIIKYIYVNNFEPEKYDFKSNTELLIAADVLCLNNLSNFIENYLLKKEELSKQNFVFILQDITNELNRFKYLYDFLILFNIIIRITKRQRREIIYNFTLLVRGSRDGFSKKIFHEYCDDKGPTITIVHVKNSNEILGGFNPFNWESWKSNKGFIETKESFIFSLDRNDLENSIFSKVVDNKNAIYYSPNYGPCFGGGKSDIELFRREKYGRCVMTSYEKAIRQDEKFFEVDEYEVFQVSKII